MSAAQGRDKMRVVLGGVVVALVFVVGISTYKPKNNWQRNGLMHLEASEKVQKKKKRGRVTLVMSADPGDLIGGFGEGTVLYEAGDDLGPDPRSDELMCVSAHRLSIYENHVLLVTTGIGTTRAALCLDSILSCYGSGIKELIFLGTAGGSPAIGGIIDSNDCSAPRPPESWRISKYGDICLSSFMTNYDCQKCFWTAAPSFVNQESNGNALPSIADREAAAATLDSACVAAPCSLHDRWDLFGDFACSFFQDTSLVDEIYHAAHTTVDNTHTKNAPPLFAALKTPAAVNEIENAFWKASTGLSPEWQAAARDRQLQAKPRIHEVSRCAEATSSTYWSGAPYDELARNYIAELLNQAASTMHLSLPTNRTRSDVIAFSAMEGTGWMAVLRLSELYLHFPRLPAANVRAVSDFTHSPLVYDPPTELWFENVDWLNEQQRINATEHGYRFAIQSASAVILSFFRGRQLEKEAAQKGAPSHSSAPKKGSNSDDTDDDQADSSSSSSHSKSNKKENKHHHHHHKYSPDDDDTD